MRNRQNRRRRGFTLLELMLVLAILVALAGVVFVNIFGAQDAAYRRTTQTQLQSLKSNVQMYRLNVNAMPESLENLVTGPNDSSKKEAWSGPIIDEVPTDAWGNDLIYELNGNKYTIRSAGPDGQINSDDDVVVEG